MKKTKRSTRDSWIALALVRGLSPRQKGALVERCGSPEAAFQVAGAKSAEAETRWLGEMDWAQRNDVALLTPADEEYPAVFRSLADAPLMIALRGKNWREVLARVPDQSLAVVGSRKVSSYGAMCTRALVGPLAAAGIQIVSGGAYGVDSLAHEVALECGSATLAVLGSGLSRLYPPSHGALFAKIAQTGILMTEFAHDEPALPQNFPQRNRLIAALGKAVLVCEAAAKSGSLITAQFAIDQGKEVLAVPGPIHEKQAQGTNGLIQQGAHLITQSVEIAEILDWDINKERVQGLTNEEVEILARIGSSGTQRESLLRELDHSAGQLEKTLDDLMEKGCLERQSQGRLMRTLKGSEWLWQKR